MPRQRRLIFADAMYHVMNRGKDKRRIFTSYANYKLFIQLLAKVYEECGWVLHVYCLMPNHFHLMVGTPHANINVCMQRLCGEYAQKFNFFAGSDGAMFRGRYHSVPVENNTQALYLSRYIHRNPVDCEQPLVRHPLDYGWSSLRAYADAERAPEWLETQWVTGLLDGGDSPRYLKYVLNPCGKPTNWVDPVEADGTSEPMDCHQLVALIAQMTGTQAEHIRKPPAGRGNNFSVRDMAIAISTTFCSTASISEVFGVSSRPALKKYRDRWADRKSRDASLQVLEQRVLQLLSQHGKKC